MNYLSKLFVLALCATVCLFFAAGTAFAAQPAISELSQVRNGPSTSPSVNWQNGNVNATQSHMVEGYSVPYRAVMINLPIGTPIELTLGYDIKHSNRHALDYLTHYQRLEPHGPWGHAAEVIDPRDGHTDVPATFMTFPIPPPSSAGSPVAGQPTTSFNNLPAHERVFTIYGGTITNVQYVSEGSLTASNSETRIKVTFTASASKVILAWGGHIATRQDWGFDSQGVPRSAGGISGSPYHMRAIDWNLGNLGNMDRSLAAAAVFPECDITGPSTACAGQTGLTFTTPFTSGFTYSWSFVGPTNGAVFTSATNTNTVTVTAGTGNFTVRVSVTSSGSTISCDHPVVVSPRPTASAGPDQNFCTLAPPHTFTVNGSASGGTVLWTQLGGVSASIASPTSAVTDITLNAFGSATFEIAVTSTECGVARDTVVLTLNQTPTASAGPDQNFCTLAPPHTFTVSGSASGGTILWTQLGGVSASIASPTSAVTNITLNAFGSATFQIAVTSAACGVARDTVVLTLNQTPTASAGPDQNFCTLAPPHTFTVSGSASGGTILWTQLGGVSASIASPTSAVTNITLNAFGSATFQIAVTSAACGVARDTVVLTLNQTPTASAGPDQNFCTLAPPHTFTVSGSASGGTILWTQLGGVSASIASPTSAVTNITLNAFGSATFQIAVTSAACGVARDTVVLTLNQTPTASAGPDQNFCTLAPPHTFTVSGSASGGTILWTQLGGVSASIASPTSAVTNITLNAFGSATFQIAVTSAACGVARDTVVLTLNQTPTAAAGPDQDICKPAAPHTFTVSGSASGGTILWTQLGGVSASIASPTSAVTNITLNAFGSATFQIAVTSAACGVARDTVVLTLNQNTTTTSIVGGEVCATSHTFSTTASGTGPFTFTWKRDGVVITNQPNRFTITSGVNTSSLLVESITVADYAIDWTVVVQGLCNRDSSTAQLSCSFTCGDPGEDEVCEGETATFCALPSGGVAPYTFSWVGPGGFASTDSCVTVGVDGIYTVTITDAVGNSCSQNYTLTVNPLPDASIIPPTSAPACGSEGNSLSAQQVTGATYSWTLLSGGGDGWAITGGANTHTITYTAGNTGTSGEFEVTVTSSAGCESRDTLTVNCTTVDAFCTLTQGFYGNYGGRHCGTTTLALIQQLLSSGPIVLGLSGQSFTVGTGDANCVIKRLPGGGPPRPLLSGNHGFDNASDCNFTGVTLKNGRFHNVLFAQALTLALNLRLDADLGDVRITNTVLVTAASSDPCAPGHGSPVPGTEENFLIPGSVLTALGSNNTVADLLALANQALGGGTTGGASLGDIATALGAINDGFDKCRFLVGFIAIPTVAGIKGHAIVYSNQIYGNELPTEYALQHNYPNPFNPSTVIEFALPEASMVRLSIYNLLGQEVATLVNGEMEAGFQSVVWNADNNYGANLASGVYFYRLHARSLETGAEFAQVKKMLLMK